MDFLGWGCGNIMNDLVKQLKIHVSISMCASHSKQSEAGINSEASVALNMHFC